ncbi:MAG: FAD-binding protein [Clostridiales bacterium]|nr:FAD-binding protein [Clostridiales bacterium]MCD7828744.1 FAD-binding protein [Clostridiales bacterium]
MSENLTKKKIYDVLVVGSGVAGMYGALQFESGTSVLMLAKYETNISNSNLAQGGVAAVLDLEDDSYDLHINDTMIAGGQVNDIEAVDTLVHEGPSDVRNIMNNMGVEFDRKEDGTLDKTLEGGHSRRRIVHYKDSTGAELVRKLFKEVEKRENIEVSDNTALYALSRVKSGFRADLIKDGRLTSVFCSYCILCTGGIGRIYKYTTNPKTATGDGIRIAYELGAKIKDLHYVQFHPTAFNSEDGEQFLISESVRGEGAVLRNCNNDRFMQRYDSRLELAPRDVVSKSIILESRRTGSNIFHLDITHEDSEFVKWRFPGIYEGCMRYGVDMTKDLIPIFPCQHYLMGGIETDLDARTTVPRLYAAGECANTGVHGKNRLASNSLLEALVFSRRAAQDIKRLMASGNPSVGEYPSPLTQIENGAPVPKGLKDEIREIMQRSYFVLPDQGAIRSGLKQIDNILKRLRGGTYKITVDFCEALSMATAAYIILSEVDEK